MQNLETASLSEYLETATRLYNEEQNRVQEYLTWDTIRSKLFETFREEMLSKNQKELFEKESGVKFLLKEQRLVDLQRLYTLFD